MNFIPTGMGFFGVPGGVATPWFFGGGNSSGSSSFGSLDQFFAGPRQFGAGVYAFGGSIGRMPSFGVGGRFGGFAAGIMPFGMIGTMPLGLGMAGFLWPWLMDNSASSGMSVSIVPGESHAPAGPAAPQTPAAPPPAAKSVESSDEAVADTDEADANEEAEDVANEETPAMSKSDIRAWNRSARGVLKHLQRMGMENPGLNPIEGRMTLAWKDGIEPQNVAEAKMRKALTRAIKRWAKAKPLNGATLVLGDKTFSLPDPIASSAAKADFVDSMLAELRGSDAAPDAEDPPAADPAPAVTPAPALTPATPAGAPPIHNVPPSAPPWLGALNDHFKLMKRYLQIAEVKRVGPNYYVIVRRPDGAPPKLSPVLRRDFVRRFKRAIEDVQQDKKFADLYLRLAVSGHTMKHGLWPGRAGLIADQLYSGKVVVAPQSIPVPRPVAKPKPKPVVKPRPVVVPAARPKPKVVRPNVGAARARSEVEWEQGVGAYLQDVLPNLKVNASARNGRRRLRIELPAAHPLLKTEQGRDTLVRKFIQSLSRMRVFEKQLVGRTETVVVLAGPNLEYAQLADVDANAIVQAWAQQFGYVEAPKAEAGSTKNSVGQTLTAKADVRERNAPAVDADALANQAWLKVVNADIGNVYGWKVSARLGILGERIITVKRNPRVKLGGKVTPQLRKRMAKAVRQLDHMLVKLARRDQKLNDNTEVELDLGDISKDFDEPLALSGYRALALTGAAGAFPSLNGFQDRSALDIARMKRYMERGVPIDMWQRGVQMLNRSYPDWDILYLESTHRITMQMKVGVTDTRSRWDSESREARAALRQLSLLEPFNRNSVDVQLLDERGYAHENSGRGIVTLAYENLARTYAPQPTEEQKPADGGLVADNSGRLAPPPSRAKEDAFFRSLDLPQMEFGALSGADMLAASNQFSIMGRTLPVLSVKMPIPTNADQKLVEVYQPIVKTLYKRIRSRARRAGIAPHNFQVVMFVQHPSEQIGHEIGSALQKASLIERARQLRLVDSTAAKSYATTVGQMTYYVSARGIQVTAGHKAAPGFHKQWEELKDWHGSVTFIIMPKSLANYAPDESVAYDKGRHYRQALDRKAMTDAMVDAYRGYLNQVGINDEFHAGQ